MGTIHRRNDGATTLKEMQEFASFPAATQRYVRRSLDVGLCRADAIELWSRDVLEAAAINAQTAVYDLLDDIRPIIPDGPDLGDLMPFYGPLIAISGFDLGQGRLSGFTSYRFLYERLLGASVRPWLPGAFAAAAMLPTLEPNRRKLYLETLPEAAAVAPGWSIREPVFYPEWVEKSEPV